MCGAKDGTSPFHGKRRVGPARFRVATNMEGQTSGGVRVVQTVGPSGRSPVRDITKAETPDMESSREG